MFSLSLVSNGFPPLMQLIILLCSSANYRFPPPISLLPNGGHPMHFSSRRLLRRTSNMQPGSANRIAFGRMQLWHATQVFRPDILQEIVGDLCTTHILQFSKSKSLWFTSILELPTCFHNHDHLKGVCKPTTKGTPPATSQDSFTINVPLVRCCFCLSSQYSTLGEASSWHQQTRHLGWVIHGQNAGRNGRRRFWCLEFVIAVYKRFIWVHLDPFWMQYRSIVFSSMLSIGPWHRECIHLRP